MLFITSPSYLLRGPRRDHEKVGGLLFWSASVVGDLVLSKVAEILLGLKLVCLIYLPAQLSAQKPDE